MTSYPYISRRSTEQLSTTAFTNYTTNNRRPAILEKRKRPFISQHMGVGQALETTYIQERRHHREETHDPVLSILISAFTRRLIGIHAPFLARLTERTLERLRGFFFAFAWGIGLLCRLQNSESEIESNVLVLFKTARLIVVWVWRGGFAEQEGYALFCSSEIIAACWMRSKAKQIVENSSLRFAASMTSSCVCDQSCEISRWVSRNPCTSAASPNNWVSGTALI